MPDAPHYPFVRALALTLVVGLIGLATDRIAVSAGWHFPSFGYLAGELVWKTATVAVMAWALWRFEHRRLTGATTGFAPTEAAHPNRAGVALVGGALAGGASVLISNLLGASASSASTYGTVHKAGLVLVLAEVLVRYPLTVFAEEAFFRGWLQPRLGPRGPVLSGVLWGAYHLQQFRTIPQLLAFGVALGLLRWWRGNVRATATFHYLGDVTFFLSTYM